MKWSIKIGSVFGIPVKVHITFLLLLILIFYVGNAVIGLDGLRGVIFVCLVFASVVFHELSHSIVARGYGIKVEDITLLPIGGVSRMASVPEKPLQEILIAAAGPASSILLGIILFFVAKLVGTPITLQDLSVRENILAQLCAVNFVLAAFNLIPAFPMDGGRILRGVLGLYLGPMKSTRIAVGVGQIFAIGLFFLGLWTMNLFIILIALFVYLGAEGEERQMGIMLTLGGVTAAGAMISDVDVVSPRDNVGKVADLYTHRFQGDFPVVDRSEVIGLLTREILTEALHKRGPAVAVEEVMLKEFPIATETTPLTEILERMQSSGTKAVTIIRDGDLKGIITLEQIGRYSMLCAGYSCEFLHHSETTGNYEQSKPVTTQ